MTTAQHAAARRMIARGLNPRTAIRVASELAHADLPTSDVAETHTPTAWNCREPWDGPTTREQTCQHEDCAR